MRWKLLTLLALIALVRVDAQPLIGGAFGVTSVGCTVTGASWLTCTVLNPTTTAVVQLTSTLTTPVTSVFTRTGDVVAQNGDYNTSQVTENTNLYFTNARVYASLSAGSPIVFNASTGVISCPTCATSSGFMNPMTSVGDMIQGGTAGAAVRLPLGSNGTVLGASSGVLGYYPLSTILPGGTQTQVLKLRPNAGNNTTLVWDTTTGQTLMSDTNWAAQTPGGTLTASSPAVVTLNPCPLGVAQIGQSLRVFGGTGTAEAVVLTGQSGSGPGSCTVAFTPANNHSGAWQISSASSGLQEAYNLSGAGGPPVFVSAGVWPIYAPAIMPSQLSMNCAGKFVSFLQGQSATTSVIDATGTKNRIEHCGFTTTSPQTSGAYFIRLGNCGAACDNAFTVIQDNYFEQGWDEILGINAAETVVAHNIFRNFGHTGVLAADANNGDTDGPWVHHNEFFEQTNTAVALACVYGTSSGGVTIDHNNCYGTSIGSGTGQLQFNIYWNATVSTQLIVDDNVLETFSTDGIAVSGVFNLVTITGNTIALPNLTASNLFAISLQGNATTSSCGTNIGMCEVTVTGNVIQGPGCPACNSQGIVLSGSMNNIAIGTNEMSLVEFGVDVAAATVTATTIGPQQIQSYGAPLVGVGSGVVWTFSAPITFANLPGAANSSILYCSDCKNGADDAATFDSAAAGAGHGTNVSRENGAWRVH